MNSDPKHARAAQAIAENFAKEQANLSLRNQPHVKGDHTPLSWAQSATDPAVLVVVLASGPKLTGPITPPKPPKSETKPEPIK